MSPFKKGGAPAPQTLQTPQTAGGAGAKRTFRSGGYAALVGAFAVAIAVVVNLLVSALPASVTKPDLTAEGLSSMSQQTKAIAGALCEDVTIYLLAQRGNENSTLQGFLNRYAALSGHIKVKTVDPVVYPNFAAQYTSDQLTNNDLIVVCGERSRHVSYYDIFQTSYTSYYETTTDFAGEQAVTSAISYVTNGDLPKVYALSGHGEEDIPTALAQSVAAQNMDLVEGLTLVSRDAVPEDAAAVILYGPQKDLSAEDAQKLNAYLDGGGKLLLFTAVSDAETPNLGTVTARFGLSAAQGIVMDGDRSHNAGYPHYLLPDLASHAITQPLTAGGYYALVPNAHAIRTAQTLPEGASVTPLLTTSAASYLKAAGMSVTTLDQEEGDEVGAFDVAVAATLSLDGGESAGEDGGDAAQAALVWMASTAAFDPSVDAMVAGANTDLFLNALGWACGQQDAISIHAKSLDYELLTVPTSSRALLTSIFVAAIPLALIVCGFLVWHRRKVR